MQPHSISPAKIRVSVGTASLLGLRGGKVKSLAKPTTAYLMTYIRGRCSASCLFCPQSKYSRSNPGMLSRILWPAYPWNTVIDRVTDMFNSSFKRVCIQVQRRRDSESQALKIVSDLASKGVDKISVAVNPLSTEFLEILKDAGVERVGISLDAANKEVFERVKPGFGWREMWCKIKAAADIFGPWRVTCHLIAGLGESERDLVETMARLRDIKVIPSLFALTPVKRTKLETMERPSLSSYRRVQVARFLLMKGYSLEEFMFTESGVISRITVASEDLDIIKKGYPFQTSGCPDCNRPFYNETPSGPIYNYAWKPSRLEALKSYRLVEGCLKCDSS